MLIFINAIPVPVFLLVPPLPSAGMLLLASIAERRMS
jgi:hypothetical protein